MQSCCFYDCLFNTDTGLARSGGFEPKPNQAPIIHLKAMTSCNLSNQTQTENSAPVWVCMEGKWETKSPFGNSCLSQESIVINTENTLRSFCWTCVADSTKYEILFWSLAGLVENQNKVPQMKTPYCQTGVSGTSQHRFKLSCRHQVGNLFFALLSAEKLSRGHIRAFNSP